MCGLLAYLNQNGSGLDTALFEQATHTMTHRGPDDFGFAFIHNGDGLDWRDPGDSRRPHVLGTGVALGHRRLSIQDLSTAGRQPFHSRDHGTWLVFNGEVYNYLELRNELTARGHHFVTNTDTEVVLAAYHEWGEACFARFNGMWAIVLWDEKNQALLACRDHFGIKPLFYHERDGNFAFASEARALFAIPGVEPHPDWTSLVRYMSRYAAPLDNGSYYADVRQVPPGTCLTIQRGRSTVSAYWQPSGTEPSRYRNEGEAREHLTSLLRDSVALRLRADVPVGTMVSGGLDSTSVIYEMDRALKTGDAGARAIGASLHGFHANFTGLAIDEADRVDDLSDYLNLNTHHVYPTRHEDVQELFHRATMHMEAPFWNSVPMVNLLLMERARQEGITVVLNGHGADELFAGYPLEYHAPMAALYLQRGQLLEGVRQVRGMAKMTGVAPSRAWQLALDNLLPAHLLPWNRQRGGNTGEAPFFPPHPELGNLNTPSMPGRSPLDSKLKRDFHYKILPSWLHLEDKISMAASVEARLPFLDPRLVEFAFALDESLKIRRGTTKVLLRGAMKDRLPDSIVSEKRKYYFSGPDRQWLTGALSETVEQYLFAREPAVAAYVNMDRLRQEFTALKSGQKDAAQRFWSIFVTEYWVQNLSASQVAFTPAS